MLIDQKVHLHFHPAGTAIAAIAAVAAAIATDAAGIAANAARLPPDLR